MVHKAESALLGRVGRNENQCLGDGAQKLMWVISSFICSPAIPISRSKQVHISLTSASKKYNLMIIYQQISKSVK